MRKLVVSLILPILCVACAPEQQTETPSVEKQTIATADAPAAIGPYSQAIKFGSTLYCSGQIAIDPQTGELSDGGIEAQTHRVLKNLGAVLKAADMDYDNVVKATVFLTDIQNYKKVNQIYAEYFSESKPAREAVEVSNLPAGAQIEISCIACAPLNK